MTALADWTLGDGEPPDVRIGVVLLADGATKLTLMVPEAPFDLVGEIVAVRSLRACVVDCEAADGGVRAAIDDRELGTALSWMLIPRQPSPGSCAPPVRVGGVPTGRGFHWETRTDQMLPGELTVRCVDGRLLLACDLPIEEYLAGVITSEMSGECPAEFLKAQCVVARSWTLAAAEGKHARLGIDLCNDDCCQRYQGLGGVTDAARSAVEQTRGLVLVADGGNVVDANYSKCCGGIVEAPEHVWGKPKPGLTALADAPATSALQSFLPVDSASIDAYLAGDDPAMGEAYCSPASVTDAQLQRYLGRVDRGGGFFRWTLAYERTELEEIIRRKGFAPDEAAELSNIIVTRRGASARATAIELVYTTAGQEPLVVTVTGQHRIRRALHPQFLFSSAFRVRVERDAGGAAVRFHLDGAGWGHGAGLCQLGALGMALADHDYRAILAHYFPTARLESAYT